MRIHQLSRSVAQALQISRVPSKIRQTYLFFYHIILLFIPFRSFLKEVCSFNVSCFFTRDWGSPLGKEFTNVGEGFCFSDAVQRSHSPLNIDHNNHRETSTSLLHHKSIQRNGQGRKSQGRGGGKGDPNDDGLAIISCGGANGNQDDEGTFGMRRRYPSGEGEGAHHYQRSSSSSSSNNHPNKGNTSASTSNSQQDHGSSSLHVHTTGSELESSFSPQRRGPQTSGSRGGRMNNQHHQHPHRGTRGEQSDTLVSSIHLTDTPIHIYPLPSSFAMNIYLTTFNIQFFTTLQCTAHYRSVQPVSSLWPNSKVFPVR